jgi:drug/metabolite transporter (DMT)-like permease
METDRRPRGTARSMVSLGHLLVGGAALVFAGVMIVAGRAPNAELDGVLLGLGLLLALAATVFTSTAVLVLRRAPDDLGGSLSLLLSIVELVVGAAMAAALAVAVQGYGAFEPWRSPLLLPSALLVPLGLTGLALEVLARRRHTAEMH